MERDEKSPAVAMRAVPAMAKIVHPISTEEGWRFSRKQVQKMMRIGMRY